MQIKIRLEFQVKYTAQSDELAEFKYDADHKV